MNFHDLGDSEMLWLDLSNTIAGILNRGLMQHERVSIAVPGGTTPGPLFDVLSAVDLEWERVDVLLTDERWVPESDPRSNARLVRERFLVDKAAKAHFLTYYTGGDDPDVEIADAARAVREMRPLTVVLLGMGTDMHTASLFPGGSNLARALTPDAPDLVSMRAPGLDVPRASLSVPVINGAMNKFLVILGEEKRRALEQAGKIGDPLKAPVAAVLDNLEVYWAKS
ncbi:MAG: 6-phosphogluconolactonase [Alphaproteobacteria bacterium]|nr:MAG: 6-phosphogluconolactonase [Alphaproteobacteria bacterium]